MLVPLPVGLVGAVRLQVWSSGRPAWGHSVGAKVSLPQLESSAEGVWARRRVEASVSGGKIRSLVL